MDGTKQYSEVQGTSFSAIKDGRVPCPSLYVSPACVSGGTDWLAGVERRWLKRYWTYLKQCAPGWTKRGGARGRRPGGDSGANGHLPLVDPSAANPGKVRNVCRPWHLSDRPDWASVSLWQDCVDGISAPSSTLRLRVLLGTSAFPGKFLNLLHFVSSCPSSLFFPCNYSPSPFVRNDPRPRYVCSAPALRYSVRSKLAHHLITFARC